MSRFLCRCGREITDITYPATHEARLVTDVERDEGEVETPSDVFRCRSVMECPGCLCLWVQRAARGEYLRFLPEGEPLRLAEQQGGYRG